MNDLHPLTQTCQFVYLIFQVEFLSPQPQALVSGFWPIEHVVGANPTRTVVPLKASS